MENNTPYMNLLFSQTQTPVDLDSPEPLWFGSQGPRESVVPPVVEPVVESGGESGLRRKWTSMEDKILIGAWLNTSKDPIISNEQKAGSFWRRIVDYYNASPQLVGTVPRELGSCKQRWGRINTEVSKFTGCYDAALREQRSGQNDDDVMKAALEIFFKTTESKFTMDQCWRELRHDQKWCSVYGPKEGGKEKRKQVVDVDREEEEVGEPEGRPPGVKAAKAGIKKKKSGREEELGKLQGVLEVKEKVSRAKILRRLFDCLLMVLGLTRLTNISDLLRPQHFCVYIISLTQLYSYSETSIYDDPHRMIFNDYSTLERNEGFLG